MTIREIRPVPPSERNLVKDTLAKAAEHDFDSVFIVGYKNRTVCTMHSGFSEIVEKIGALELLKSDIIKGN